MARHQLQRMQLDNPDLNVSDFFEKYLGKEVLKKFNGNRVSFSNWPEDLRKALQILCIYYAEKMPEADHVVRADVDTPGHVPENIPGNLLMYFGLCDAKEFNRSQYTGVSLVRSGGSAKLVLFVAGTPNPDTRIKLIQDEDSRRELEGKEIANVNDVNCFAKDAIEVLSIQRKILINQKKIETAGFCPVFCQQSWNRDGRLSQAAAAQKYWDFWKERHDDLAKKGAVDQIEREKKRMTENNYYRKNCVIAYVQDYVPIAEAYNLALSEHA